MYHFIRSLVKEHYLKDIHVDNRHNHINLLTKPLQGAQYLFERDNLMNVASRILQQPPSLVNAQILLHIFEESYWQSIQSVERYFPNYYHNNNDARTDRPLSPLQ